MKKFSKILVFGLALVVFLTGTGATNFNFCCDTCISDFFASGHHTHPAPKEKTAHCCESEGNMTHHDESQTCPLTHGDQKDCCFAKRQSIDIDSTRSVTQVIVPFIWANTGSFAELFAIIPAVIEETIQSLFPPSPPKLSPRSYLAKLRVLII